MCGYARKENWEKMDNVFLRVKNISDLLQSNKKSPNALINNKRRTHTASHVRNRISVCKSELLSTPLEAVRKYRKHGVGTTVSKRTNTPCGNTQSLKRIPKTSKKDVPVNQTKIDSFFPRCVRTLTQNSLPGMDFDGPQIVDCEDFTQRRLTRAQTRKRLFGNQNEDRMKVENNNYRRKATSKKGNENCKEKSIMLGKNERVEQNIIETVDLCSDSDEDRKHGANFILASKENELPMVVIHEDVKKLVNQSNKCRQSHDCLPSSVSFAATKSEKQRQPEVSLKKDIPLHKARRKVRKKECPSFKIVAETTFAVDAFQYGSIDGVTHYFLSHFHADHYVGLTKKFSMPLFVSPVTARLLRTFIPLEEKFIHEIELNRPMMIAGVEVTAIDANHCPGAVMFIFKLPNGKCILHCGDFRASADMESEPIFWNNHINTIYLDTTYLSNKYDFMTQGESISKSQEVISDFRRKYPGRRILYICGSYLIGKEKFWSAMARVNGLLVWTEAKRYEALQAMGDEDILSCLRTDPHEANMHVLSFAKLSYFTLLEYFEAFSSSYDVCLAFRPSGWETNSKPQFRGKINIVGIEYSEHSSYNELKRFVVYLRPEEVISTVPVDNKRTITSEVPQHWYKYEKFPFQHRSFQPTITNFMQALKNAPPKKEDSKESFKANSTQRHIKCNDTNVNTVISSNGPSYFSRDELDYHDEDWLL